MACPFADSEQDLPVKALCAKRTKKGSHAVIQTIEPFFVFLE
jgi:hypothetical protein